MYKRQQKYFSSIEWLLRADMVHLSKLVTDVRFDMDDKYVSAELVSEIEKDGVVLYEKVDVYKRQAYCRKHFRGKFQRRYL